MSDAGTRCATLLYPLTPGHLAEVLRIERAGQQHPWSVALLQQELSHEHACHFGAAPDECSPVGAFILCRLFCGELHIHNLCCDPPLRRRGLATALLRHAIEYGRGHGAADAFLEVRRTNAPAIAFYTREGFIITGVRESYYANGDDALLMHRVIT